MTRHTISSGSSWEPKLGYSRAVRVGPHVYINATAATDEHGKTVGVGDVEAQTRRVLEIIEQALDDAGASLADVVKTRMLLVNMDDWETVGRTMGRCSRPSTRPHSCARSAVSSIRSGWSR